MIPVISANKRAKRGTTFRFNQANGALSGWDYTNNAWTVASNKVVTTPTLGAELYANGGFDADTNWTKGAGWTIGSGVASHTGAVTQLTQNVGTLGNWNRVSVDVTSFTSGTTLAAWFGSTATDVISKSFTATGSYIWAGRQTTATTSGFRSDATASIDNASAKVITLSDTFATKDFAKTSATLVMNGTFNSAASFGLVGWLDSYTVPANYILVYYTGGRVRMDKVVGGTVTNLVNAAQATFSGIVKLVGLRSGADLLLEVFVDGVSKGTSTVSDAGVVGNTRHGMFNTDAVNRINSFTII